MRILLDECVPRRLAADLQPHSVKHVSEMGWRGVRNGRLIALARAEFDVVLTVDARFAESGVAAGSPGILVVRARTNRHADLVPFVGSILEALERIRRGERIELSS